MAFSSELCEHFVNRRNKSNLSLINSAANADFNLHIPILYLGNWYLYSIPFPLYRRLSFTSTASFLTRPNPNAPNANHHTLKAVSEPSPVSLMAAVLLHHTPSYITVRVYLYYDPLTNTFDTYCTS